MGTGLNFTRLLNCTRTKLHECTKLNLHEAKFARGHKVAQGKKLHEDDFAPRVNFARVTFLHESKTTQKKI